MSAVPVPPGPPAPPAGHHVAALVATALAEDLGQQAPQDPSALLVADLPRRGRLICRETAVLCGRPWFEETCRQVDARITLHWQAADGDELTPGQPVCELHGPARSLLRAERTALNLLQTLSSTASAARAYARAIAHTEARVFDTRKTLPGLRLAQKYAVRCGGGGNQRLGLYDAILIKENHIAAAGSILDALRAAEALAARHALPVQIEVESLTELQAALEAGARLILLDNFPLETLREAVALNRRWQHPAELEASGNVTLETIGAIAATGVTRISCGGLTKHVQAVDFSLRLQAEA